MPRQDGTGPRGEGSMTGRKMGPCGDGLGRGRRGSFRRMSSRPQKEKESAGEQN